MLAGPPGGPLRPVLLLLLLSACAPPAPGVQRMPAPDASGAAADPPDDLPEAADSDAAPPAPVDTPTDTPPARPACDAALTATAAAPYDVLYDSRTALDLPGVAAFALGTGAEVVDTERAWATFEALWGLDLVDPDLANRKVVVAWATAGATCGLDIARAGAWDLGDGAVTVDVAFEDDGGACLSACDGAGVALWVVAVDADAVVVPCVEVLDTGCPPPP